MAFGKGQETKEPISFDRYVGIAPFFILGVNMSMAQLKQAFPDRQYDKEPTYSFEKEGKKGTYVTFQLKLNEEHKDANGIKNFTPRASFLILDEPKTNREGTKCQVINSYGDTIWLTKEELQAKVLPDYAVKQAFSIAGMRVAYNGEAELVDFIKKLLRIPASRKYNNVEKVWSLEDENKLKEAYCQFEVQDIKAILAGNTSLIWDTVKTLPTNQIKLLCGVRTSGDDNKEYQEICTRIIIPYSMTKYEKYYSELQSMKNQGSYPNSDFGEPNSALRAYNPAPTSFQQATAPTGEADPFGEFMPA